ncbi:MAG TPA: ATP-dependent DNA ligase, partial [Gammaproteobacteria bacterium]|nr:ATP-dependent DNA ligase [Gammaproteobacteria bacterium]
MRGKELGSFNDLQKRLNKKKPTKKDILNYPTAVIAYDLLSVGGQALVEMTLTDRRTRLAQLV